MHQDDPAPPRGAGHGLAPWVPAVLLATLAATYAATGNQVRAGSTAAVAALVAGVTLVQVRRGRALAHPSVGTWLPIALPAIVSRLVEDPVRWEPSALLLAFSWAMALVAGAGIDPRRPVTWVVSGLVTAIRVVAATLLGVVVILPLGLARLWRRADPLGTGAGTEADSAWHDVTSIRPSPRRSFRLRPTAPRSTGVATVRMLTQAIGLVVLVLAADFGLGWAWQEVTDSQPEQTPVVYDAVGVSTQGPGEREADPREDLPAMADSPWIGQWFQEFNSANRIYWPYLLWRHVPFEGEYLNMEGAERRTYRSPSADPATAPDVAFLGGSTTFGIAQRDEHTIASEVARLAEAEGLPIVARNYGVSGYVLWQEMLLLEQLAADEQTRPDLAVFYDGANEVSAQTEGLTGVPSHTVLSDVAAALGGPSPEADGAPTRAAADPQTAAVDLISTYRSHSAVGQAWDWLSDQLDRPAGATPAQVEEPTAAEVDASIDIYRRGRALATHIADTYDIEALFFWQPRAMYPTEQRALADIDEPTIDISDALDDHQEVYIDGNHHNEAGARYVAEAIWEHLGPGVAAWYDQNG